MSEEDLDEPPCWEVSIFSSLPLTEFLGEDMSMALHAVLVLEELGGEEGASIVDLTISVSSSSKMMGVGVPSSSRSPD